MKILVFMSDNRRLEKTYESAGYYSITAAINYEYCKRKGYDFIYYRPYLDDPETIVLNNCMDYNNNTPRHASWSKILCTIDAIKRGYDYVMYVDSDCIVKDFDMSVEEMVMKYSDKDILFSTNAPWCPDKPCAGVFICKSSDYTMQFLKDWYNVNIPQCNINHAWEQIAAYEIYKNYSRLTLFDNKLMFQERSDQQFRHICHTENHIRVPYFKNFLENKSINFVKNMEELTCVDFNTLTINTLA